MASPSPNKSGFRTGVILSLLTYFGLAFILHLIWENAQAPLYAGFESLSGHFGMCLYATATGDMIFAAVIYIAMAAAFSDPDWLRRPDLLRRSATWALPLIIGPLLAVSFELWAIYVEERWVYGELMPIVPVVKIGLTPLAQMMVLPPAGIVAAHWVLHRLGMNATNGEQSEG